MRKLVLILLSACFFFQCNYHKEELKPEKIDLEAKLKKLKKDSPEEFFKFHEAIREGISEDVKYPSNYLIKEFQKAKNNVSLSRTGDLPWEHVGPGNVSGRTRSVLIDFNDPELKTWYAGSVGGGIWKTEDEGQSWMNLTADFPAMSISSMVQSNEAKNIIFAATGNHFVSRGSEGNGIWTSDDEGATWNVLASTQNENFTNISRIAIGNENKGLLLASTVGRREFGFSDNDSRIMKSTDQGITWEEKYFVDERIQQVIFGGNDVAYASVRNEGILRSNDQGETWNFIFQSDDFNFGRIEIAAQDEHVYLSIDVTGDPDKIFKSSDFGDTWHELVRDGSADLGNWLGGQGWFDNTIAIASNNPNRIYLAGQSAMIRINTLEQGQTATTIRCTLEVLSDGYENYGLGIGSKGVHVDHHALIILSDPNGGPDFILNGNDGGISFSRDGGETFRQTGDTFAGAGEETLKGYNVSQFYGVDKKNGEDRYVGGTQDNGSWVSGVDPDEESEWRDAPSGDGFEAAWNYRDGDQILESSQFNNIFKSNDGGLTWTNVDIPRGSFITRIEASKLSPDLVIMPSRDGILRSNDFGTSFEVIAMPEEWAYNGSTGPPIEISLASPRIVWTGSTMEAGNQICLSKNGGFTFDTVSIYTQAEMGTITGIASHPINYRKAYVLFSAPDAPKVLTTDDYGESWTDLSGYNGNVGESNNGFPDVATYSLLVMPFDTNRIWAGTEIGIFESVDGGLNWEYADNGLPPVPVWQMKIVNDEIVVATHARGIWKVTMPELKDYEPTTLFGLPSLLVERNFGSIIHGSYELPTPFEESLLSFVNPLNGQVLKEYVIPANTSPVVENFTEDFQELFNTLPDSILDVEIVLETSENGFTFSNRREVRLFNIIEEPLETYTNSFDNGEQTIARLGFTVEQPNDFDSPGLNSIHNYEANVNYISIIRHPLVIEDESFFSFDEVVIVETGNGDPTSAGFYDFVSIEATKDRGENWIELAKYDSSYDPLWESAYDSGESGRMDLTLNRSLDLNQSFSKGDTVFIRFKLFADGGLEAWGWSIDNINYQTNSVSTTDLINERIELNVFPNPLLTLGNLNFKLAQTESVIIHLVNLKGQVQGSIYKGVLQKGDHQFEIKRNQLTAGIYFVQIQTESGLAVKKIIIQ